MKPKDDDIGPWNFRPGTPAWIAAMLEFQEKCASSKVHVHIAHNGEPCACERCKLGFPPGPKDVLIVTNIPRAEVR